MPAVVMARLLGCHRPNPQVFPYLHDFQYTIAEPDFVHSLLYLHTNIPMGIAVQISR